MRNVCLKALVLAAAFIGLAGSPTRTEAQIVSNLIQFTNVWKYDQSGLDLGTAWRSNSFNDAAWPSGPGLLGYEPKTTDTPPGNPEVYVIHAPPNNTKLKNPSIAPVGPVTVYFRSKFNFSGSTANLILVATNLLDDGAVVYLNGGEVGRIRIPSGTVDYTTLSVTPAGETYNEGQLDPLVITNFSLLKQGENLIAVELHQSSATSSDLQFGMKLTSLYPTALVITNQPKDITVAIGDPSVTLSVGVSGGPVSYRWQKGTQFITGATNSTFTQTPVTTATAGAYRVVLSNALGSVTSLVANITVVPDTTGPEITLAVGETNTFRGIPVINMTFNEALTRTSATNRVNYSVYLGTNLNTLVPITNVVYNPPRVYLFPSGPNWIVGSNYFVVVNGVTDARTNNIDPNSIFPVAWEVPVVLATTAEEWLFYDSAFFDPTFPEVYSSLAWTATNYNADPTYWAPGIGIFNKLSGATIGFCAGDGFGTGISFQNFPTLFRRTIFVDTNVVGIKPSELVTLGLTHIEDDGLILYLNGKEIYRTSNMLGVPAIGDNARANSLVQDAACSSNSVTVTNLFVPGVNTLAAGVYQSTTPQNDTVFGLRLNAVFTKAGVAPQSAAGPYRFTAAREGANLRLSWPSNWYGFKLQSATNLGPNAFWSQVVDQANPYVAPAPTGGPAKFYRLIK